MKTYFTKQKHHCNDDIACVSIEILSGERLYGLPEPVHCTKRLEVDRLSVLDK